MQIIAFCFKETVHNMIGEDRVQLNERFRKVFDLLEKRGAIVKNDRNGRGMGDFAEKILGNRAYGHIIRAFLNPEDKRCIDYRHARILCQEYNVNESYMLDGIGEPFGMNLNYALPQDAGSGRARNNILFTSKEAFAGATVDSNSFEYEEKQFFNMPDLHGSDLVAFPINGNSMEPVINGGDIVICRQIERFEDIKDNKIYAVKNRGSVWIKYVQKIYDDQRQRVRSLKLISANYLEHDPWKEEVDEYTKLYQVIRCVRDLEH